MNRWLLLILVVFGSYKSTYADVGVEVGLYSEGFIAYEPYSRKYGFHPTIGVQVYFQAGKFITLNYSAGITGVAGHTCIRSSLQGITAGALSPGNTPAWYLLLLIPDGIGFYTRKDHTRLHFSLDFLASDYYYLSKPENDARWFYSPSLYVRYRFELTDSAEALVPYLGVGLNDYNVTYTFGVQFTFEKIHIRSE